MTAPGFTPSMPRGSRGFARRAAGPAIALVLLLGVGSHARAGGKAAPAAAATDDRTFPVAASVESDPVPKRSGELDDPAIWVHPTDPAQSRVLGTFKKGGLAVYDLAGRERQRLVGGRLNNVDLRYGFELAGESVALALASNFETKTGRVAAFTIGADGVVVPYSLELIEPDPPLRKGIYGLCMYRSPDDGALYVFFTSAKTGDLQQWRISAVGGAITAAPVRRLLAPGRSEGCVADDELAALYVGVEKRGIYRFPAEPDAGDVGELVAAVEPLGPIKPDLEGLALYPAAAGGGYLLASSQGRSEFVVFERGGDHAFVTRFRITAAGAIDEVTRTDGIEVVGLPLSAAFPKGLFVAQDDKNPGAGQNFKFVPWERIAEATSPALEVDTSQDPRP